MSDDDANGFVRQAHGGALKPFGPGNGASAARAPWRSTRRGVMETLRDATPAAVAALVRGLTSTDERVRIVSAEQLLNRVLGKPGALAQGDDADRPNVVDLTHLTAAEQEELAAALDVIARLTGRTVGTPTQ